MSLRSSPPPDAGGVDEWRTAPEFDLSTEVDGATLTAPDAIEQLLGAQIQLRKNRRLQAAMRSSRLPAIKRLTEFDFSFQPSLPVSRLESLHELGFVERRENVVFLGPPGLRGTSHRSCGARKRFAGGDASLQLSPFVLAQSPGVVSSSTQHLGLPWNVTNPLHPRWTPKSGN
jgi:hypothetical protein